MKGMAQVLNLKPYPAYKDSGIPGGGSIPPNWEAERLKGHVENVVNPTRQREPGETYIALEHVESWTGKIRDAGDHVNFESQVKRFQERDVLFGKLRPYLAKVTAPNRSGVCTGEFLVLRPLGHHLATKFLEKFLRSKPIIDAVDASTFGAKMPRADWSFIGNMEMPVPPPDEQTAIVRFLDHADEQIQRYIAAKGRLIALLEEQRQALVHQAVTRGLDPNVRLKESGVEWLGNVPEHWGVRRLRYLGEAIIGLTYEPQEVTDSGTLVLRASNIRGGEITLDDRVTVQKDIPSRLVTQEGDILICSRSGSRSLIGKNARIGLESAGVTFGAFMTIFRGPNNDYLHQVFNSKLFEYQSGAFLTSTINQLTLSMIHNIHVPFPPEREQQEITQFVVQATKAIKDAINRHQSQTDLMNEYRARLIADVVTGQLDVREAAERLPAGHQETNLANDIVITQ